MYLLLFNGMDLLTVSVLQNLKIDVSYIFYYKAEHKFYFTADQT